MTPTVIGGRTASSNSEPGEGVLANQHRAEARVWRQLAFGNLKGSPYFSTAVLVDPQQRQAVVDLVLEVIAEITEAASH